MDALIIGLKALFIGMGFFSIGVSVVVMIRYGLFVYRRGRPGLLPIHVTLVSMSYNILLLMAITSRLNDLGDPFARWTFYIIAITVGTVAMTIIAKHEFGRTTYKQSEDSG